MGTAVLSLRNVAQAFAGPTGTVQALGDVTLEVAAGEFVAIVGPSGCGKSTLLNVMVGLLPPTEGAVAYKGEAFRGVNTHIGYVTQADNLFPWRTALENVAFGLQMRGLGDAAARREQAARLLDSVGLAGFHGHYRHQLSGGMRQRVNIARTLAYGPDVILLDEPFGPLDAQTRLHLQDLLLRLWQEQHGATVVFITHDLTEAIALADRVVVMTARPGRIREQVAVPLPRPRDVYTVHTHPDFRALYDRIWASLGEDMKH